MRLRSALALSIVLVPFAAAAQALPEGTPQELREGVETIQRYYGDVGRRLRAPAKASPPAAAFERATEPPATAVAAMAAAVPIARDPFDVTPELRSGGRARRDQAVGANLLPSLPAALPHMRLRALIAGARPLAIIAFEGDGRNAPAARSVTLREGDALTLEDGTTLRVKGIQDGVVSILYGLDATSEFLIR
ncbi:MAG: hypothetical protein L6Q70_08070 [Thauera sp.]|jgi:hypothetical protein|nr:hypothetical protein [Thauera sp.]